MTGRPGATATRGPARTDPGERANPFAVRARSRRRRRWAAGLATVLVLAGAGRLLLGSSLLAVREIRIVGTDRVPVDDVRAATAAERGRPMVLVDLEAVSRRVNALPLVHDVRVLRQWPGTLVVTVHERVPIAAVPVGGTGGSAGTGGTAGVGTGRGPGPVTPGATPGPTPSQVRLVDRDGVQVAVGPKPAGLPFLQVDVARSGPATLRSALDVLGTLPAQLRTGLRGIGADSPDGVWVVLSSGVTVIWGDPTDGDHKAAVLHAVITASDASKIAVVDVSAPDAPAVTNRR